MRVEGIGTAEERRRRLLELVRFIMGDGAGDGDVGGAGEGERDRDGVSERVPSGRRGPRLPSSEREQAQRDGRVGEGAGGRP